MPRITIYVLVAVSGLSPFIELGCCINLQWFDSENSPVLRVITATVVGKCAGDGPLPGFGLGARSETLFAVVTYECW